MSRSKKLNMSDETETSNYIDKSKEGDNYMRENGVESNWIQYEDDEGRTYYYNPNTGESSWELPEDETAILGPSEESTKIAATGTPTSSNTNHDIDDDTDNDDYSINEIEENCNTTPGTEYNDDDNHHGEDSYGKNNNSVQDNSEDDNNIDDGGIQDSSAMNDYGQEEGIIVDGDWTMYYDDNEGREYFYNSQTGETQWDRPDGFNSNNTSLTKDDYDKNYDSDQNNKQLYDSMDHSSSSNIQQHTDQNSNSADIISPPSKSIITSTILNDDDTHEQISKVDHDIITEKDPQDIAREMLNQPDAVLEPNISEQVAVLFTVGGVEGAQEAMQSLFRSYNGQTAICGLLAHWLVDLKTSNLLSSRNAAMSTTLSATTANTITPIHMQAIIPSLVGGTTMTSTAVNNSNNNQLNLNLRNATSDSVRSLIEQIIAKKAKENFTTSGQDAIFQLSKNDRAFLEEMMEHSRWRKLLIDLSALHKDSALLTYCLQSISKRGFHREISKRINQSEYFGVFQAMLTSELGVLGKLCVGLGYGVDLSDITNTDSLETLTYDLKRTCTSSAYTYIYAMEMLSELIERAKNKKSLHFSINRAIRKWTRLKEDFEANLIKESANTESNPLSRKRRADIALVVNDLQRSKRLRQINSQRSDSSSVVNTNLSKLEEERNRYSIESAILSLLKNFSMGVAITDDIAEQLLHNPYEEENVSKYGEGGRVGVLLVNNPSAVKALQRGLFMPGVAGGRIKSLELKLKCAKLIAMCTLASERNAAEVDEELNESHNHVTLDELSKVILKGSQLCEEVENLASFVVTEDITKCSDTSIGRQLSSLCIQYAPVAQGFLIWASEKCHGNEFAASAVYSTLAPGILSLTRIIAKYHPFTRERAMDIAFMFLGHSNTELSYQKINALKEQSLRLLLWLSTMGLAVDIFHMISVKLQKGGSSDIDASLVRYFISGALDIIQPPLSLQLVRSLCDLFASKGCVEALNSVYFDEKSREVLLKLFHQFSDMIGEENVKLLKTNRKDHTIVSSVMSLYQF